MNKLKKTIHVLLLLIVTSCAIISPDISDREYCKQKSYTYVCSGNDKPETTLNWLIREHKRLVHENN